MGKGDHIGAKIILVDQVRMVDDNRQAGLSKTWAGQVEPLALGVWMLWKPQGSAMLLAPSLQDRCSSGLENPETIPGIPNF